MDVLPRFNRRIACAGRRLGGRDFGETRERTRASQQGLAHRDFCWQRPGERKQLLLASIHEVSVHRFIVKRTGLVEPGGRNLQ